MTKQIITNHPNFGVESIKEYHNGILVDEKWYDEDGNTITFHRNGEIQTRYIYNDKPLYQRFYDNGQLLFECNLVNGRINGLFKQFHNNGKLKKQGFFVNGYEEGKFEEWDEEGNLLFIQYHN